MLKRLLMVVLVTTALLVAGPIVARTLATASPAEEALPVAVGEVADAHTVNSRSVGHLPDEAAMALIGTALLAAGAAMRKAT